MTDRHESASHEVACMRKTIEGLMHRSALLSLMCSVSWADLFLWYACFIWWCRMCWSEIANMHMKAAVKWCREETKQTLLQCSTSTRLHYIITDAYFSDAALSNASRFLVLIVHLFDSHCLSTPLMSPKHGKYKLMRWLTALSKQYIWTIKSECRRHSTQHFNATVLAWDRCPQKKKQEEKKKGVRCLTWCSQQGLVGHTREVGCLHFQILSRVPSSACTACLHITTTRQHHICDYSDIGLSGFLKYHFFFLSLKTTAQNSRSVVWI